MRIDQALGHPELAGLYEWLDQNGPARVADLRTATGARKGSIDRLVMAGPVARILAAEAAKIAIGCGPLQAPSRPAVRLLTGGPSRRRCFLERELRSRVNLGSES